MKTLKSFGIRFLKGIGVIVLFLASQAYGAWFENLPTTVMNPDGSVLELLASGDEFFNYLHDQKGYTVVLGKDGFYYYGIRSGETIVASQIRYGSALLKHAGIVPGITISDEEYLARKQQMHAGLNLQAAQGPAHQGTLNNLVVYIRFSDDTEFTAPANTFEKMFNAPEGPSVQHYFQEVSYNQLRIQSHHFPSTTNEVRLSYQDLYPRAWYQPFHEVNNPNGYRTDERTARQHELLHRAIKAIEPMIPAELDLDNNHDGMVDNVSFIIRGMHGAWNSLLWAHRWTLSATETYIHQKRVWDFTFQPESQTNAYVLSHELFHVLGAPDLYRYSAGTFIPVGPWDLMHTGFVHMGAYMKYKYTQKTWIPQIPVISEPGTYTLNPLTANTHNAFRINSPYSDTEYFIVEYRQRSGHYESTLPGSGLLVYRINTESGNGNAYPPDEVYIFRPQGTTTVSGQIDYAHLTRQTGRSLIHDNSNPALFLSDGSATGLYISHISDPGANISFALFGNTNPRHHIQLAASPSKGGTSKGAGTYGHGEGATLEAIAAAGYRFSHWSENGIRIHDQAIFAFEVLQNRSLIAHFEASPVLLSLQAIPAAAGTLSGAGIYPADSQVTIQAKAHKQFTFLYWEKEGEVFSRDSITTIELNENLKLRAIFRNTTALSVMIKARSKPEGVAIINGEGEYSENEWIALEAIAQLPGYSFWGWTENDTLVSTDNPLSILAQESRNLIAEFVLNTPNKAQLLNNLKVYPNPSQGVFQINLPEQSQLEIYNPNGQLLKTKALDAGNHTLNLEGWHKGLYLLRFQNTHNTQTIRAVIR